MSRHILTRDAILSGELLELIAKDPEAIDFMTDEERGHWLERLLDERDGPGLWIFGYGSLMWNPAIHVDVRRIARIYGLHRRFCLWVLLGRGTREHPGLMLGLDRGGSCRGVAIHVEESLVRSELDVILRRELLTSAYQPRWVNAVTDEGEVSALTFVIDRHGERYAPPMSVDETARYICAASGVIGKCCDYLFETVEHLHEAGINDHHLERLADTVRRLGDGTTPG